jgi:putative acetyltransferase
MNFTSKYKDHADEITTVIQSAFTDSEGIAEGQLIGKLVQNMLSGTPEADIYVFSALDEGCIVGSIIFTRLNYSEDDRSVFLLAPVAVATNQQRKGIGQRLIQHGLNILRDMGVDVALTYGDIKFYAKVGFSQIPEQVAKPPLSLNYPEGWLGKSLHEPNIKPLLGQSTCVDALNDPAYW